MKQLITSIACMMLLLALVIQFAQNQVIHSQIMAADQAVNSFGKAVRQSGRITAEDETYLREALARILNQRPEDITVLGPRSPLPRGEWIEYTVEAEVEDVIAMAEFWDMGADENSFAYRRRGSVVSEYREEASAEAGGAEGSESLQPGGRP